MMKRTFVGISFAILLISAQFCSADSVETEPRESSHDEISDTELEIHSVSTSNAVEFQIHAEDSLEVEIHYGSLNSSGDAENELEFKLSLDGVGEYQSVADPTELSFVDFSDGAWTLSPVTQTDARNEVTASWVSGSDELTVDITFSWANDAFTVNDPAAGAVAVPPSAIKWTVAINNFSYTASSDSILGISGSLETGGEDGVQEGQGGFEDHSGSSNSNDQAEQDNFVVSTAATNVQGLFSWAATASAVVNGVSSTAAVTATRTAGDGGSHDLVFLFDAAQPSSLVWDPVVGATGNANSAASIACSLIAVIAAVALVL